MALPFYGKFKLIIVKIKEFNVKFPDKEIIIVKIRNVCSSSQKFNSNTLK
jgi:hypothetical protein